MPNEETPPIRPRIAHLGEKAGAIVIIALVLVALYLALTKQRPMNPAYFAEWTPRLLDAAKLTLFLTVVSYLGGMGLGFLLGWARAGRNRVLRAMSTVYVESVRGTPLFVQLFVLVGVFSYYRPWNLDLDVRLILAGILAMLLNTSAYQAEIFRGGLQSVHTGQLEAAHAIGLTRWGTMRFVVFPQALRLVIPPLMNEFVALLKASSLLALPGVRELTYNAKVATGGGAPFLEVDTIVVALYLLMTVPLAKTVGWIERRYRIPGLGLQEERAVGRKRPGGTIARVAGVDAAALRAAARSLGRRDGAAPTPTRHRAEPS